MRSNKHYLIWTAVIFLGGCAQAALTPLGTTADSSTGSSSGGGPIYTDTPPNGSTVGSGSSSGSGTSTGGAIVNGSSVSNSGSNVMTLTVNGSLCASGSYFNKPCVSVTICTPGTSTCQTISDILLDTGSYGLRIFQSAISVPLTTVASGSRALAECVQFGDGSSDWGTVKMAGVILAGESAVQTPIQVIDSTLYNSSAYCSGADTSPSEAGFNGILGVGLFQQDCGADCVSASNNQMYYACTGSSCIGAAVPLSNQVTDPAALLSTDNNGVILQLPSIGTSGAASVNGYLVLGIGTESNNVPSGVTAYPADPNNADFQTQLNGSTYTSFIDSGSNAIYMPAMSSLTDCSGTDSDYAGWFCPSSTASLTATNIGINGSPSVAFTFQIGNFYSLYNSSNNAFMDAGGDGGGTTEVDWGLPFYFGRNIYVGFENTSNGTLGAGPYWAY